MLVILSLEKGRCWPLRHRGGVCCQGMAECPRQGSLGTAPWCRGRRCVPWAFSLSQSSLSHLPLVCECSVSSLLTQPARKARRRSDNLQDDLFSNLLPLFPLQSHRDQLIAGGMCTVVASPPPAPSVPPGEQQAPLPCWERCLGTGPAGGEWPHPGLVAGGAGVGSAPASAVRIPCSVPVRSRGAVNAPPPALKLLF